ncbi:ribonuclease HII [Candidatus Gottesmanbacteria bacterium]|nr:ribonuclease HII [Candidatus Gottesmanbacteria bacterium]
MPKPNFSFEKKYWKKGYKFVIGVDEVGRGALAGSVVAGAAVLKNGAAVLRNIRRAIQSKRAQKYNDAIFKRSLKMVDIIKRGRVAYLQTIGIDDSKRLTAKKRDILAKVIKRYFFWGIGEGSVAEINRLGIVKATERAMRRALKSIKYQVSSIKYKRKKDILNTYYLIPNTKFFLLIDAFHVKYILGVGLKNQKAIIHGDQKSISVAAASIIAKVYRDTLMQKLSLRYKKYHWGENKGYGTAEHRIAIRKYGINRLHRKDFVKNWL